MMGNHERAHGENWFHDLVELVEYMETDPTIKDILGDNI